MSQLETTYMYLTIMGDFDPDSIISQISMIPWESYKKHSKSTVNGIPCCSRVSYGKIEVVDECPDLYQMSDDLYQQLEPYADEFIFLSKDSQYQFCCSTCLWMVHDLEVSTPSIGFHSAMVRFLGRIGARIDVDTYRDDEYKPKPNKTAHTNSLSRLESGF